METMTEKTIFLTIKCSIQNLYKEHAEMNGFQYIGMALARQVSGHLNRVNFKALFVGLDTTI